MPGRRSRSCSAAARPGEGGLRGSVARAGAPGRAQEHRRRAPPRPDDPRAAAPARPQHAPGSVSRVAGDPSVCPAIHELERRRVAARMRALARASVGQARSEMALTAAQVRADRTLQPSRDRQPRHVEAVARLRRRRGRYVVVTRERTTAAVHDRVSGPGAGMAREPLVVRCTRVSGVAAAAAGPTAAAGPSASGSRRADRTATRRSAAPGGTLARRRARPPDDCRGWRWRTDPAARCRPVRDRRHLRRCSCVVRPVSYSVAVGAHRVLLSNCSTVGLVSSQYIYTTYKLSRRHPPDKEVLSDISLSFMPGAKIGVLGYNGAGKSTLLRIMAGVDTEFDGQAQLAPGRERRTARAGAAARPDQGRARKRGGGDGRGSGAARPVQRAVDELLRGDRRGVRARPGADRRCRRVEPRHDARDRDGRSALSARRMPT